MAAECEWIWFDFVREITVVSNISHVLRAWIRMVQTAWIKEAPEI